MQECLFIADLPQADIIFDACCLINLYQASVMDHVLLSLGRNTHIADYVATKELSRIDFNPLILGHQIDLVNAETEEEKLDFITFIYTHQLHDGESVTGAIARSRQWIIATDDGNAIDCFTQIIPHIVIVGTPELVRHWADTTHPNHSILYQVLKDIRVKGNYYPGIRHPLFGWWQSIYPRP